MKRSGFASLVAGACMAASLVACGISTTPAPTPQTDGPTVLAARPGAAPEAAHSLSQRLSAEAGLPIRVVAPETTLEAVRWLAEGRVQGAWLHAFASLHAQDHLSARPLLAASRNDTHQLTSQIMARVDAGINEMSDLKGHRFLFVNAPSLGGFVLPRAMLAQHGIDYITDFASTTGVESHEQIAVGLYSGRAEAGAALAGLDDPRLAVLSRFPDVMLKLKTVAVSEPVPREALVVGHGLPGPTAEKLAAALLALSRADGRADLQAALDTVEFQRVSDADYAAARRLARWLKPELAEIFR